MIYLTFDTNIWIYLLDDSWKISNQLDIIESWIDSGLIEIVLPEIILTEWVKHKKDNAEIRKKNLSDFFRMAEQILPATFYSEYKKPKSQQRIISDQLLRIENIIQSAKILKSNSDIKSQVINAGLLKKAPMHKKSSVADAIIIFSFIDFAKKNLNNDFLFLSGNKADFFFEGRIHPDLKDEFNELRIRAFKDLKPLINNLKFEYKLPVRSDIDAIRKARAKNRVKDAIYNPEYEKLTSSSRDSYIQNIKMLKYILGETTPTKEQVFFVLALIDSDSSYESKFYSTLENKSWFGILKLKGVFDVVNNPPLIVGESGGRATRWEPLVYIRMLSQRVVDAGDIEMIDDLVAVIKDISKRPSNNYLTWSMIVETVINLPNECISKEILDFIPTWLNNDFYNGFSSRKIGDALIVKFIEDDSNTINAEKVELVLRHLLTIETFDPEDQKLKIDRRALVDTHALYDTVLNTIRLHSKKIIVSENLIRHLADNIKDLRYTHSLGLEYNLAFEGIEYSIHGKVVGKDLLIVFRNRTESNYESKDVTFYDFESYDRSASRLRVLRLFEEIGFNYEPTAYNEHEFSSFLNAIVAGSVFSPFDFAIDDLKFNYDRSDSVDVFELIFKELVEARVARDINKSLNLVEEMLVGNYYRFPFFRKMAIYVMRNNWLEMKSIFWNEAKEAEVFYDNIYFKELKALLQSVEISYSSEEIKILNSIIDSVPEKENDLEYRDWLRLRWYSTLKQIPTFERQFSDLAGGLGLPPNHFDHSLRIKLREGSDSPYSPEEIIEMEISEIVMIIEKFKPKTQFERPNIVGLSNALRKAVETKPVKYSHEIRLFANVPYAYVNQILIGLRNAWGNNKSFDWEEILLFLKEHMLNDKFYSDMVDLSENGGVTNVDSIIYSVSDLLAEGLRSDDHAFELELLPIAKEILFTILEKINAKDNFENSELDYSAYLLNSADSKALESLLFYFLRKARNNKKNELQKWDKDEMILFERTLEKGVLDGYLLIGRHFDQFYFLDKEWLLSWISENDALEDRHWLPFIHGFNLATPPLC